MPEASVQDPPACIKPDRVKTMSNRSSRRSEVDVDEAVEVGGIGMIVAATVVSPNLNI